MASQDKNDLPVERESKPRVDGLGLKTETTNLQKPIQPLETTFVCLGTASMTPSTTRNVSGNALRIGKEWIVIDCGEGTQHQIIRYNSSSSRPIGRARISPGDISRIFVTHLHGDHCFGLPGLLCLINNNSASNTADTTETKTLHLVGPKGLRNMVRAALLSSGTATSFRFQVDELWSRKDIQLTANIDSATTSNKIRHYSVVFDIPPHPSELPGSDILPIADNKNSEQEGTWIIPKHPAGGPVASDWTIRAGPLVHTIESVGFVFEEHPHQGKLDASSIRDRLLAQENRIYQNDLCSVSNPLVLLGNLQRGESIRIREGGSLVDIHPEDHMTPSKPGRKLVVLGDTCDSRHIAGVAANADLLVHEATNAAVEDGETEDQVLATAVSRGHSTPEMAGTFAKCCAARSLLLTHFSSRYKGDDSDESMQVMGRILDQARKRLGRYDTVIAARDFLEIHLPMKQVGVPQSHTANVSPLEAAQAAATASNLFFQRAGVNL